MTTRRIQLAVPNPCHQPWQAMDPTETGRFCQNCQKTVVDFVGMSDQQLVAYFAATHAPVCGRFTANQLNRSLAGVPNAPGSSTSQRWLGLLTAGLISWSTAQGQASRLPVKNVPAGEIVAFDAPVKTDPQPIAVDSSWAISGQVVSNADNKPLAGVAIIAKGTDRGAVTDTAGLFKLTLTDYPSDKLVLTVSSIGFITQEFSLASTSKHQLVIALAEDSQSLGEVIYTGYAVRKKPSFWQRLKNGFRAGH